MIKVGDKVKMVVSYSPYFNMNDILFVIEADYSDDTLRVAKRMRHDPLENESYGYWIELGDVALVTPLGELL